MTAGRRRKAAASSVQISAGSHGVSVIDRPAREVLLQQLQRLRVGVGRPVLAGLEPGVGADEQEGRPRAVGRLRLGADRVQARRDVAERREEGAVGRPDADVAAEGGEAGEDAGHRVLADAADRERARRGVRRRVPEAVAEAGGHGVDRGRAEQVGRADEDAPRPRPCCSAGARARARRAASSRCRASAPARPGASPGRRPARTRPRRAGRLPGPCGRRRRAVSRAASSRAAMASAVARSSSTALRRSRSAS